MHEALHLSAQEEGLLVGLLHTLRGEYERSINAFSQDVLMAQLDVLPNYANRFYHRQFLTRRMAEYDLLNRSEAHVAAYFAHAGEQLLSIVQDFTAVLHVSPAYLGDVLRALTGENTQQHLHHALMEKTKRLMLSNSLTVKKTAFRLGFDYPQYFSRLFKRKTGLTPAAFRFSARAS